MSLQVHPNLLTNYSARTWVTGEALFSSILNKEYRAIQERIARLNDATQDTNSHHSGTTQPTTKTTGQCWMDSNTDRFLLDPDGIGADQPVPRVLKVDITAVSLVATTGTLITYTIPSNTLVSNGKIVRFCAWGTKSGLANVTVLFKVRLNGSTIATHTTGFSITAWKIETLLIRTAASSQDWQSKCVSAPTAGWNGASPSDYGHGENQFGTSTVTDSSDITFDITLSGFTNNDTITQEGLLVELLN